MITVRKNVDIFIVNCYRLIQRAIDCVDVEEAYAFGVPMVSPIFSDLEVVNLLVNCGTSWKFIVAVRRP